MDSTVISSVTYLNIGGVPNIYNNSSTLAIKISRVGIYDPRAHFGRIEERILPDRRYNRPDPTGHTPGNSYISFIISVCIITRRMNRQAAIRG